MGKPWWDNALVGAIAAGPLCYMLWRWMDPRHKHADRRNLFMAVLFIATVAYLWWRFP
ncbi:MAG: hypothetical protein WC683_19925 [bacterium]